ncbi:MAG TPA: hypothetical protein PKZ29_02470, partial [Candidatus Woesebacteria bacterium]|nr:hypothetical protein [Candidatus Woesebacteria bacterium]
ANYFFSRAINLGCSYATGYFLRGQVKRPLATKIGISAITTAVIIKKIVITTINSSSEKPCCDFLKDIDLEKQI